MKTDVETKMQDVAKGGYRTEDMTRHIAQGQKRVEDKVSALAKVIARTAVKMERLNPEELEHTEFTVDAFLKRREMTKDAPREEDSAFPENQHSTYAEDEPVYDESPANSTGIGGDCSNCGRENVQVYSDMSKHGTQFVDVCQDCLKDLL